MWNSGFFLLFFSFFIVEGVTALIFLVKGFCVFVCFIWAATTNFPHPLQVIMPLCMFG